MINWEAYNKEPMMMTADHFMVLDKDILGYLTGHAEAIMDKQDVRAALEHNHVLQEALETDRQALKNDPEFVNYHDEINHGRGLKFIDLWYEKAKSDLHKFANNPDRIPSVRRFNDPDTEDPQNLYDPFVAMMSYLMKKMAMSRLNKTWFLWHCLSPTISLVQALYRDIRICLPREYPVIQHPKDLLIYNLTGFYWHRLDVGKLNEAWAHFPLEKLRAPDRFFVKTLIDIGPSEELFYHSKWK